MALVQVGNAQLNYEEYGSGFPILLLAPGGMRSAISYWDRTPWDPRAHLAPHSRVIAMDQRNAGRSTAPVSADDGWHVYTADQLGLLDALGVDRFHVCGMCIGGPFIMGLIEAAPDRVVSGVLMQPIGLDGNRQVFYDMFDEWADELAGSRPATSSEDWADFREAMYGGDFMFNVTRPFVQTCTTPLLILMGNDVFHPEVTSREVAALAPNATLVERWKEPPEVESAKARVAAFLAQHTPG